MDKSFRRNGPDAVKAVKKRKKMPGICLGAQRLGSCGSAGFITIASAEDIRSHANESHVNWDNGISPIIR
jgi:hypothetical protein